MIFYNFFDFPLEQREGGFMKRIFALCAALFLVCGSVFAEDGEERVIHSFGMSLPTVENQTWGDFDDDNIEYDVSGIAFNVFYNKMTVEPSRFSKLRIMEFGYEGYDVEKLEFSTFNSKWTFGWGGAPLVKDRVILAVHGIFGFGFSVGTGSYQTYGTVTDTKSTLRGQVYTYDQDMLMMEFHTFLGANCQASFRLTDHFGLFAGTKMYFNLIGLGVLGTFDTDVYYAGTKIAEVKGDTNGNVIYPGSFNIDFRIGISLIY